MKKILILAILIPLFGYSQDYSTLKINDRLPLIDLELKSVDDMYYSLESLFEDNGLIVIFTSNTCPFVVMWEDRYKLAEKIAEKNKFGLVYINSNFKKRDGDDSFIKMQMHSENMNYQYQYLLDFQSKLANSFGAKTTPHIFMFNEKYQLVYKGAIDDNYKDITQVKNFYLKDAILEHSQKNKIKNNSTKAVGCSIKRYKSE